MSAQMRHKPASSRSTPLCSWVDAVRACVHACAGCEWVTWSTECSVPCMLQQVGGRSTWVAIAEHCDRDMP